MCEHSGKRTWRDETNGTTKPNTQHVTIFHPTNDPRWFVDTFKCMLGCVFKKIVDVLVIVWMGLASLPSFVHCTAHSIVSSLSRPLRLACCVCLVHSVYSCYFFFVVFFFLSFLCLKFKPTFFVYFFTNTCAALNSLRLEMRVRWRSAKGIEKRTFTKLKQQK